MAKRTLTIVLISLLFNSCRKDDRLSIDKTDFTGNQLKTNGYYYQTDNSSYFDMYLFYRNGTIISAGGNYPNIAAVENYINTEFIQSQGYKDSKLTWGLFKIDGNQIEFERWYPGSPGEKLKAYVRAGHILNDTTFIITESYRLKRGKKKDYETENETYHFNSFGPKPDSTNTYVKLRSGSVSR